MPFLLLIALLPSISLGSPTAIYGEDNRVDLIDVPQSGKLPSLDLLAASTVVIVPSTGLVPTGNGMFQAKTKSLRELFGVCSEVKFASQPTFGFCTGTLVGPDLILTAAHCLFGETKLPDLRFVFGFSMDAKGNFKTSFQMNEVFSAKALVFTHWNADRPEFADDVALIRLSRSVPRPYTPIRSRNGRIETPKVSTPVALLGYPDGLPLKFADGAEVKGLEKGYVRANLDSFSGNSGSPVFNAKTGEIFGILSGGGMDYPALDPKRGCKTPKIYQDSDAIESVTAIDSILPFLPR